LQQAIEKKAYEMGGENQFAPAQRATDFIYNKKLFNFENLLGF